MPGNTAKKPLRIAIAGCKGTLGRALERAARARGFHVIGFDLPQVDVTQSGVLEKNAPDFNVLINAAAFSDIDAAETQRETAYDVNAEGARILARLCSTRLARFVQISCDSVFDGQKPTPYGERDIPNPVSVYGASKLAGEKMAQGECGHVLVVRCQGLFGGAGDAYGSRILQHLREERQAPLKAPGDVTLAPTYAGHLADALLRLVEQGRKGLVHFASRDECTWHDFALAAASLLNARCPVVCVTAAHLLWKAPRPTYSVLSWRRYHQWTEQTPPTWQEGLEACVRDMAKDSGLSALINPE